MGCEKVKLVILRASDEVRCLDSGCLYRRCPKNLNSQYASPRNYERKWYSPPTKHRIIPLSTTLANTPSHCPLGVGTPTAQM
jgi:hypothetical protein